MAGETTGLVGTTGVSATHTHRQLPSLSRELRTTPMLSQIAHTAEEERRVIGAQQ